MAQKLSVNGIHAVKDDIFSLASRIPENAGKAPVGTAHVNTTFNLYKGLSVLALTSFIFNVDTRLQNAGLALLFPGGAFLGLGGILADRVFTDTIAFRTQYFPLVCNGQYSCALLTWPGQVLVIPLLPAAAGSTTYGIYAVPALVILTYYSLDRWSKGIHAETLVKRDKRDRFLPTAIAELQKKSASVAIPEDLELGEEELGQLRFLLQVALQDKDDWRNFSIVEQFQPSAFRYQLCEVAHTLAFANKIYTPSFRGGYLHEGQKKIIQKYCQEKVLWY
ncbi:hypothetical protein MAP00_009164 [Monascus purpureus]|nr:hypothetical protein MAP00_009164 [Monascus purpureus]